ncbi:metallopeptidase family protein [Actinomyces bowdenii]|nr:metallopeptidase family protein [Actinomyces bowdenii]
MTRSPAAPPDPMPVPGMSEEEFEQAVGDALDRIPPDLAEAMDNVVVLIQDEPDPDMLRPEDYDEAGLPTLLGLYDGTPLTERDEGWSMVLPDRILIFRGPLQRWCTTREELVEETAVTVIHEVAHHFGIDDERLHELGWA